MVHTLLIVRCKVSIARDWRSQLAMVLLRRLVMTRRLNGRVERRGKRRGQRRGSVRAAMNQQMGGRLRLMPRRKERDGSDATVVRATDGMRGRKGRVSANMDWLDSVMLRLLLEQQRGNCIRGLRLSLLLLRLNRRRRQVRTHVDARSRRTGHIQRCGMAEKRMRTSIRGRRSVRPRHGQRPHVHDGRRLRQ